MTTPQPTDKRECEVCDYIAPEHAKADEQCKSWATIVMCPSCLAKEQALVLSAKEERESKVKQVQNFNEYIERSRQIDNSVTIKTDLFNAATVAIVELQASIEQDSSIPPANKKFALADLCMERFLSYKEKIFSVREELIKLENEQRAYQIHLQSLGKELTEAERTKLNLSNLSYQPPAPKSPKPAGERKPSARKFNMVEVKAAATKYNVPANMIQMIVTQRNVDVVEAAKIGAEQLFGKRPE